MSATVELTQQLIARPSVTPVDGGCQELLAARLLAVDFRVERMRFGVVDNLWALRGQGEPVLCFAGHTDVVPAGPMEQWLSDPFVPQIRQGVLYGRGAADMKSGLAAMVTAGEAFVAERPAHRGTLALLITSDEEGPAIDGTKRALDDLAARGTRINWCVVGEPSSQRLTGDVIKVGRRGSLSGQLTVHGESGHIAYPQLAENPVHGFAPALAELTARTWGEGDENFQPTSFQISNLHSGTGANNVIPGELTVRFNFRYPPAQSQADLKSALEEVLGRHRLRYRIDWQGGAEPYYATRGKLLEGVCAAVRQIAGSEPVLSTDGGTSDGRFFARTGAEVVELGVPNPSIHKLNECVRLADIDALHTIYLQALRNLLG
jgi:succinyl-diaminopimelate desuccinylase